jgi:hypothetical protein
MRNNSPISEAYKSERRYNSMLSRMEFVIFILAVLIISYIIMLGINPLTIIGNELERFAPMPWEYSSIARWIIALCGN